MNWCRRSSRPMPDTKSRSRKAGRAKRKTGGTSKNKKKGRLSKNLYNEKGRPPYPYQSAKSRDLCVAFCTSQGRGPRWSGGRTAILSLVRWPDGHTFFAFLRTTGPARERSMGAEALRQPLAKTRKSGLSHFFDTLLFSHKYSKCSLKQENLFLVYFIFAAF